MNKKLITFLATLTFVSMATGSYILTNSAQKKEVKAAETSSNLLPFAPTISPVTQPSDRALKLAGFFYATYQDEKDREYLRKTHDVKKSSEEQEMIDHAYWWDKHPAILAKNEVMVENIKKEQSSAPVYVESPRTEVVSAPAPVVNVAPPAQSYPKHCTSNQIGDYTYTNCY